IKRFMMTGLTISLLANLAMGILGFVGSAIPTFAILVIFATLWGINGWSQSMGSPPAIISLSRWFPLSRRGTFYGIFSASHNLGEFFSFLFVGNIVLAFGWQWGFVGSSIAGVIGVILIYFWLHDTPQSMGLPAIETISNEQKATTEQTSQLQRQVLTNPAVWVLAAASAFMYVSRYAINSWGVLYLEEAKGFSNIDAVWIISINALLGIFGTVLSGWFSDSLFKGDRRIPALIFGVMNSVALVLFIFGGSAMWVNVLAMSLFGVAMGVLICFLGGLMAVDIVPRKASGAALGIVGVASYIAAGVQDVISGWLIESASTILEDGSRHYNFTSAAIFWIGASVISFLLPILNWKYGKKVREN
ncbi:MAG: MFS transporter, partial [Alistipes sp.]|nr:MFS transporter [Alistipes sp.]